MSEGQGTSAAAMPTGQTAADTTVATPQPGAETTGANDGSDAQIKEAAREAIRKHKLKVDGQEIEVDEEELKRGYSHQRAANKILQEGKAAKKQAETFVQMMKDKTKLFDAISKLGHDPRKLAEEYLASQLEEELMDPREKELKHAKLKLQQYEELEKKQKENLQKRRDDELKKKYSEEYSKSFVEALKETRVPANKATIAEMAKYISRSAKIGFEMTAKEAAQMVREDIENAQRSLYGDSDAETLVKLLGENGLQKIRAYDTGRLKDPHAALTTPADQGPASPRASKSGKRMSAKEWREFNRK